MVTHNLGFSMIISALRAVFAAIVLVSAFAAAGEPAAPAPAPEAEWQKIETKPVPLAQPRQVLSPGIFDDELFNVLTFPKDGAAIDTGLPHAGKDKAGKEHPKIMARYFQNAFWIDFNGDGKPGKDEISNVGPDGMSGPFTCELHYEDGTSGQYVFRLKTIVEKEKYAILRSVARTFDFEGKKFVLLDDNGNGKYGDIDKDALIAGDNPVCLLGKHMSVGVKFFEILVHDAGATVEIRPAGKLDTGWVDLFEKYTPSQKSENLKIHTLIVSGPQGSFAMDERTKNVRVPVGAYDIVFGLFERAKETVYMKKGEKTSFTVNAGQVAVPAWGGVVKAKFDISSDDKGGVVVGAPSFVGEGSERYFPENFRVVPVAAAIAQVQTDRMKLDRKTPFGGRRFEVLPNGGIGPVTFKPYRSTPDEYEISVDYNSGIMGSVNGRQRYNYVPPRKKTGEARN